MPLLSKIIQCVPNFSEGRNAEVVRRIVEAVRSGGAKVIDFSMDPDHNRSVITFIGGPESISGSILAGARAAVDLIDLRSHQGAHPRLGAIDVVPLVPISGVTMQECVRLSHEVGKRIAEELHLPVYFYEKSATVAHRSNLADVRKGGFEALAAKELSGDWSPDAGPDRVHPSAGAVVVGARGPLIAFNVNLASGDIAVAMRVAEAIRKARRRGELPGVRAIGVDLASRGIVQVSTNITQPDKTTLFDVYEFVRSHAAAEGAEVAESEMIGVIRRDDVARTASRATNLHGFDENKILDHWLTPEP